MALARGLAGGSGEVEAAGEGEGEGGKRRGDGARHREDERRCKVMLGAIRWG